MPEAKHCVVLHVTKEKTIHTASSQHRLLPGYYATIAHHAHIQKLSRHAAILFRRELTEIQKKERHLHTSLTRLSTRKIPALKLYYFENNPLFSSRFHETISE